MRPEFSAIQTGKDFDQWYWTKAELIGICKSAALPYSGSKADLRERIIYALDHNGQIKPAPIKTKKQSRFNWANAELNLDTIITDNVSFGPNFRGFMKKQIGARFQCHSDFMDWVRSNTGKTLADAALAWQELENRKKDPNFQREIAQHNRLAQYVRDFLADNEGKNFSDALNYWNKKRQLPAKGGLVIYEPKDLDLN